MVCVCDIIIKKCCYLTKKKKRGVAIFCLINIFMKFSLPFTETWKQYAYFYRPMYNILEDGYTMFRCESEFAKLLATDEWRVTHINKDYSVCPTYGACLVVPKSITDEEIIQSAAFRDGGRFPLLSYRHENGVDRHYTFAKCQMIIF